MDIQNTIIEGKLNEHPEEKLVGLRASSSCSVNVYSFSLVLECHVCGGFSALDPETHGGK